MKEIGGGLSTQSRMIRGNEETRVEERFYIGETQERRGRRRQKDDWIRTLGRRCGDFLRHRSWTIGR